MTQAASETPQYVVEETLSDNFEIRRYVAGKWACTTTNGETNMFDQLFQYISGMIFAPYSKEKYFSRNPLFLYSFKK